MEKLNRNYYLFTVSSQAWCVSESVNVTLTKPAMTTLYISLTMLPIMLVALT